jgi:hypothetical protein
MKRFFIALNIVLLLAGCNDKPMNETNPNKEEVVIKEPIPVSNVSHVKDGNTYTVKWGHDGVDVLGFNVFYGCTDGKNSKTVENVTLSKDARQFIIVNDWDCFHDGQCETLFIGITVWYVDYPVTPKYQPRSIRIDYDFAKAE